jgi:hypothetical protein
MNKFFILAGLFLACNFYGCGDNDMITSHGGETHSRTSNSIEVVAKLADGSTQSFLVNKLSAAYLSGSNFSITLNPTTINPTVITAITAVITNQDTSKLLKTATYINGVLMEVLDKKSIIALSADELSLLNISIDNGSALTNRHSLIVDESDGY